jgi:hypothetical protein
MLSLRNTLYQATLQRIVNNGLNPENARKSVTKEFKNDYDTTPGTYFIPKDVNGIAVNNAAVKDKADSLLLLVEKFHQAIFAKDFKQMGEFLADTAIFYLDDGTVINGKDSMVKYAEINFSKLNIRLLSLKLDALVKISCV